MKICCISDTHGLLPKILIEADILLHAGDFGPLVTKNESLSKLQFMQGTFNHWLKNVVRIPTFIIAGNHDFMFETYDVAYSKTLFPANTTYLQDTTYTIPQGITIWGSPWQLTFHNWAFNKTEEELDKIWGAQEDLMASSQIWITHSPPYGYLDITYSNGQHVGSTSLLKYIKRHQPLLCCFGHIHEGRGITKLGKTTLVNASLVDERYRIAGPPLMVEVDQL